MNLRLPLLLSVVLLALCAPGAGAVAQTQPDAAVKAPSESPASAPAQEGETPAQQAPAQAETPTQEAPAETTPAQGQAEPAPIRRPHDADELGRRIGAIIEGLDKVGDTLTRENLSAQQLDSLRDDVNKALADLNALIRELEPKRDALSSQLEKLGEPPAEGQPAEPPAIAAERASLQAQVNSFDATIKAAKASQVRANQYSEQIQTRRRALFTSQLFERTTTPLSLSLWQDAFRERDTGWRRFKLLVADTTRDIDSNAPLYLILAAALALFVLLQATSWFGVRHFREWNEATPPPFWQRAASGAWVIILRALPIIVSAGALYGMLVAADLLVPRMAQIVYALVVALITVAIVSALSTTILAPNRPHWRILPANDAAASRINKLIFAIAAVFGIDQVVSTINEVLYMPLATTIAQSSATNVLFAVLFICVLMTRMGEEKEGRDSELQWLEWLRVPGYLIAGVILLATAIGYVAFGRFIATQVVVTGSILIVVYLMLVWTNAFGDRIRTADTAPRGVPVLPSDKRRREQMALVITLVLKAAVFILAFPFILLQWGFNRQDLQGWAEKAFFGFQVGGLNISIATVVGALAVFLVVYAIARVLLNWLDSQVMEPAGLSGGARDSVRTGLGYVGFIASALIAVSYAGVDFSNLAIVAGALSVGIGFGLQSIVNNFVSGLILLAERPIKVGDWVVVGEDQGYVRKISVRSTEIETFDRANIVVPNSMLISEKVQNWTLHNNVGRITIAVGVSYSADPERVRDILLEVASQHPQILTHPEPYVWFSDFGSSSLDFKLFCFALNITRQLAIQTDLRIAIVKRFREEGIEIPFPQSDVHLRDLDWLKTALGEQMERLREERAREDGGDGPPLAGARSDAPAGGGRN